ncbi:hypothetical protein FKP32DRAFT_1648028 [Trametes sanguinea]|nr:hypothetical protein FKP32DRAFT_1648028 [Trametes sanguinea]
MSTERLPNEVLERIVDYAVSVPTATFEAWREPTTYATTIPSNAPDILTVSKRWHDLGVTHLYEAAILRTPQQAEGYTAALQNPRLRPFKPGQRLQRLRIENGYNHLVKIINAAPGIEELFLGLNLSNADTIPGLQRTWKKLKISRLYLDHLETMQSTQPAASLIDALAAALPVWKDLKRIDVGPHVIVLPKLLEPLSKAPGLEYVSLGGRTATLNLDGDVLLNIAANGRVKVIHIREESQYTTIARLRARLDRVPEKIYIGQGKNMVAIMDFPANSVVREDPGPLPELPDKIWERILGFATHAAGFNYLQMDDELFRRNAWPPVNLTRRNILLVCKKFHRLGLQFMYSIPHFASQAGDRTVQAFISRITSSRDLAAYVRVLFPSEAMTPVSFSAPLTNLVRAHMQFEVFPAMAEQTPDGSTLALEWMEQLIKEPIPPSSFLKCVHLRFIVCHGGHANGDSTHGLSDALPQLETLCLNGVDSSLFDVFTAMSLPSLRNFKAERVEPSSLESLHELLQKHGSKLQSLTLPSEIDMPDALRLCHNLIELAFPTFPSLTSGISFIEGCESHPSVSRIAIAGHSLHMWMDRPQEDSWYNFSQYLSANRAHLPALEEVRVHIIQWPIAEYQSRSSLCGFVAHLLREVGLALADTKSGKRWARFKPVPLGVKLFRMRVEKAAAKAEAEAEAAQAVAEA